MRYVSRLALGLCMAALVTSCKPAAPTGAGNGSEPAGAGKQYRVAFLTNNASDFWTIARRGVEQADQEIPDVTAEFRIPSEGTAAEQRRIVDDLLAKGVEGMAVSLVDPLNETPMINEISKKIPIVTQDSDAPDSDRLVYIGTDKRAAGKQAGELIKEVLPNGGKIMVFVGKKDAQNAQERLQGIKDAIAGTNIEIVDVRTDDTDQIRAKSNVADTLVKYPDIACLVGLWAYNGPAILNAVREANKLNQVQIVCFDEDDQTLAGIKEGAIHGTIVQQPYEFGYQSVKLMAQIAKNDRSGIPANGVIAIEHKRITRDNVNEFHKNLNKLLGK